MINLLPKVFCIGLNLFFHKLLIIAAETHYNHFQRQTLQSALTLMVVAVVGLKEPDYHTTYCLSKELRLNFKRNIHFSGNMKFQMRNAARGMKTKEMGHKVYRLEIKLRAYPPNRRFSYEWVVLYLNYISFFISSTIRPITY